MMTPSPLPKGTPSNETGKTAPHMQIPAKKTPSQADKTLSFFEFWPAWVMYLPVAIQWVVLSLYYRSLTLPFLANPSLKLSGMVGVPKSDLMIQATGKAAEVILPWVKHTITSQTPQSQAEACLAVCQAQGFDLPFACKPDIGCRGVGVKLAETFEDLRDIIQSYPVGADLICQKLASYEPEVGIFYVRDPATDAIDIPSMTNKILPRVEGDGVRTLGQLVAADRRAGQVIHLYDQRHQDRWHDIPAKGEVIRLVFSASHSKGAVFFDVRDWVTPALKDAIREIMQDLPNFYYGRLDVKYADVAALQRGEKLEVVEINGASAESIHIWDKDVSFFEALRALMWQYRTLFKLGAYHRSRGKVPPSITQLLQGWRLERRLTRLYPLTD